MMKEITLDEVLESLPVSFFHYRLLIICGLAFMADAMEVSLLSYLSTCAGDEWNLSDSKRATITGVVFAGELFGSLFWGPIADKFGRKVSFLISCFLISGGGFLTGLAPSYGWLLFFRALVGFGVGGLHVPFDLLAEFVPGSHRGSFLINIEYFWSLGSLFVNGVAWATLSEYHWRVLAYITAIPVAIASIACYCYLPESPRWLMVKGRISDAEKVVRDAAVVCGVQLEPFTLVVEVAMITEEVIKKEASYYDLVKSAPARRLSLPLWTVWFLFGFTYYGIILFVSRLYTSTSSGDDGSTCSFDYQSIFINCSAELAGVFIASIVIDRWGRCHTQSIFYVFGGIAVALMGMHMSVSAVLAVSILGRLSSMAASCATWVATPELYPTETRATGHSVCNSAARLGGFFAPYFVVSSVSVLAVGLVLGSLNGVSALCAAMLPETSGLSLDAGVHKAAKAAAGIEENLVDEVSPEGKSHPQSQRLLGKVRTADDGDGEGGESRVSRCSQDSGDTGSRTLVQLQATILDKASDTLSAMHSA